MHQNYLVDNLVPSSSAYQSAMAHAANSLTALGVPLASASMAAFAYVSRVVQQQATLLAFILAFIDVFRCVAVVVLVMAPVALRLLPSQTERARRRPLMRGA